MPDDGAVTGSRAPLCAIVDPPVYFGVEAPSYFYAMEAICGAWQLPQGAGAHSSLPGAVGQPGKLQKTGPRNVLGYLGLTSSW